ncbi:RluA family pseudouridine synthase [Roseivirga echinicomitans]|uniref:RNA pseudouridine synthase n=1 Tax=Roseivirga echinicomitans TaxID=296218 RepID=A0A150XX69_9BACT|nr:RluA family pseudouridine synthase [Roseivirga echinicomitans]KYG83369.1 RNA pseudouridine synthase [Roseivirga echinicomitans]
MSEGNSKSKKPSRKHKPPGLKILHEDRDIIVVDKSEGLLTISNDKVKDKTAHFFLNNYVQKGNPKSRDRVFIVHRLDRDTSGVLVFAKNQNAKAYLQEEWSQFNKKYYAIVLGKPPEMEGEVTSYLMENSAYRMYSTKDSSKGKFAKTGYKVVKSNAHYSLLEIELFTGRKNQIRVHMSDIGCPIAGDKVYGKDPKVRGRLALHAASLTILHPYSKKEMTFETGLPNEFKAVMS